MFTKSRVKASQRISASQKLIERDIQQALLRFLGRVNARKIELADRHLPESVRHKILSPRVFFSYAWEPSGDSRTYQQLFWTDLKTCLETVGLNVWFDGKHMINNVNSAMQKGIKKSDTIILMGTKLYAERTKDGQQNPTNVRKELDFAMGKYQAGQLALFPILFEGSFSGADATFSKEVAENIILSGGKWITFATGERDFIQFARDITQWGFERGQQGVGLIPGLLGFASDDHPDYRKALGKAYEELLTDFHRELEQLALRQKEEKNATDRAKTWMAGFKKTWQAHQEQDAKITDTLAAFFRSKPKLANIYPKLVKDKAWQAIQTALETSNRDIEHRLGEWEQKFVHRRPSISAYTQEIEARVQAALDKQKKHIDALQSEKDALAETKATLTQSVSDKQAEAEKLAADLKKTQAEYQAARVQWVEQSLLLSQRQGKKLSRFVNDTLETLAAKTQTPAIKQAQRDIEDTEEELETATTKQRRLKRLIAKAEGFDVEHAGDILEAIEGIYQRAYKAIVKISLNLPADMAANASQAQEQLRADLSDLNAPLAEKSALIATMQAEKDQLAVDLEAEKSKLQALEKENIKLSEDLQAQSKTLTEVKANQKRLKLEKTELRDRVDQLTKQETQLQSQIDSSETKARELATELAQAQSQGSRSQVRRLERELREERSKSNKLTTDMLALKAQQTALSDQQQQANQAWQDSLKKLEDRLGERNKQIQSLQAQRTHWDQEKSAYGDKVQELTAEINRLRQEMARLANRQSDGEGLKKALAKFESEKAELEKAAQAEKKRISELEQEKNSLRDAKRAVEIKLSENTRTTNDLRAQLKAKKVAVKTEKAVAEKAQRALQAEKQRITKIEQENAKTLEASQAESARFKEEVAALKAERSRLLKVAKEREENKEAFGSPIGASRWGSGKPPKDKKAAVEKLLTLVAQGEQHEAEKMLKKNPKLLHYKADVADLSERQFKQVTAFQYAIWALDWHMWSMLIKYFEKPEHAAAQMMEWECAPQHGGYFSFDPLLGAYKTYIDNYDAWSGSQCTKHWCTVIGQAQRHSPAHVLLEYTTPDRPFYPVPSESYRTPDRPSQHGEYNVIWAFTKYYDDRDDVLGKGWALSRGLGGGVGWRDESWWSNDSLPYYEADYAAVIDLSAARAHNLQQLRQQLKSAGYSSTENLAMSPRAAR